MLREDVWRLGEQSGTRCRRERPAFSRRPPSDRIHLLVSRLRSPPDRRLHEDGDRSGLLTRSTASRW